MFNVGILTINGFGLMSYASLIEPLRAANLLNEEPLYNIINITVSQNFSISSSGLEVRGTNFNEKEFNLDLLLVLSGGDPFLFNNKIVFNWLNRMIKFGTTIGGVSGGPVVLVKAGIMKGRRMTVHWEHAGALLEYDERILLEKNLYIIDRDRMTCAGGTAPMDMMLALIAKHKGSVFAQLVSDWFLHTEIRPAGGPQRGDIIDRIGSNNYLVVNAVEFMENHLADPLTLSHLSDLCGVSERQLNRVFKKNLKSTTMMYYTYLRLESAKNLMRNSKMSISEISEATGFSNPSHFSSVFKKIYGYSPKEYKFTK